MKTTKKRYNKQDAFGKYVDYTFLMTSVNSKTLYRQYTLENQQNSRKHNLFQGYHFVYYLRNLER